MKCRKNADNKSPKDIRTKQGRIVILSYCEECDSKKSKFIKEKEARGILSSLGIKTALSEIPLVGHLLF